VAYGLSANIPGIQPFVTSINMGFDAVDTFRTNDCLAYIDKLSAASQTNSGRLILSASAGGYANTNTARGGSSQQLSRTTGGAASNRGISRNGSQILASDTPSTPITKIHRSEQRHIQTSRT